VTDARFPGFNVLDRSNDWDEPTRRVVLSRVDRDGRRRRFFSDTEAVAAGALLDRLLGLDDAPDVPVLQLVEERLADGQTDGWRYDDLPEDGEAWRTTVAWLDEDAGVRQPGHAFAALAREGQIDLLEAIHSAHEWHGVQGAHVWSLWTRYACAAFFSHPYAWNDIGFGGPAYPTGYKNLGINGREAWEVPERDATDPQPWAERVEQARRRHARRAQP
jgi:hypothetical protein